MAKKVLILAAVLVLFAGRPGESGGPDVRIEIKSPVEVGRAVISLGDIAAVSGSSGETVERLSGLKVGKAPLPGRERTLSLATVRVKLRQAGFDPDSMSIAGPTTIVVRTRSARLTPDALAQAVRDYVRAAMPWDERDVEIQVFVGSEDILVPDGVVSLQVEALPTTRLIGSTSVRVTVFADGQPFKVLSVRVRVDVALGVVVAAGTIVRYQTISLSDLRVEVRDLGSVPEDVAVEPSQVVGMRASHTIQPGRAVGLSDVESPPVVRKGDPVTIQVTLGGVAVEGAGEALDDGCEGACIRVRNTASGAVVRTRVVDAKTVVCATQW